MQTDTTSPFDDAGLRNGVCVADGWGIKIHVRNGHLVVDDGSGSRRRQRRYHKATSGLTRLVIIGRSGYLTFEAVRWLANAKVPHLHIDTDGTVLATSVAGADKPALRRAQALAPTTGADIEIARMILTAKTEGQRDIAKRLGATGSIENAIAAMAEAREIDTLRTLEAQAAAAYWELWGPVEANFNTRDRKRVPDHWLTFGRRSSTKAAGARKAINPINAVLNYLYALLEAETRIALLVVGLDPGFGIIHADLPARNNLALDLMEVGRPDVDRFVLDFLDGHVLRARDFCDQPDGTCRLARTLAHRLSETCSQWRDSVAHPAEDIAARFAESAELSTAGWAAPLTQVNRRRAQGRDWTPAATDHRVLGTRCESCGAGTKTNRKLCNACLGTTNVTDAWLRVGRDSLATKRRAGSDPAHGGNAAKRRADKMLAEHQKSRAWDETNDRPEREAFNVEVLPVIASTPLRALAAATGLSVDYCSKIRRGLRVPHPRHWEALRAAARPPQADDEDR